MQNIYKKYVNKENIAFYIKNIKYKYWLQNVFMLRLI